MRIRTFLPQVVISGGIAVATGHWWLILIPLLLALALMTQSSVPAGAEAIRELDGRIWVGNRRLGRIPWLWPKVLREQVLILSLSAKPGELDLSYRSELAKPGGSPLLGVDMSGAAIRLSALKTFGHALILGSTGSGKTELLRSIVPQLRGDCWCADYKGGIGLRGLRDYARETTNLSGSRDEFWQAAIAELAMREQAQQNRQPLFLVVDELAAALNEPVAQRAIDAVARKGRGLGLHLLVASQNLSGIPRSVWTNLHIRIVLAPSDVTDALQLGIESSRVKSLAPHQGLIRTPEQTELFWFPKSEPRIRLAPIVPNPLLNFAGEATQNL